MKFRVIGLLIGVFAFLLIISVGVRQVGSLSENNDEEQMEYVRQAVQRAAVQCYALEGAYPPSLQYLEDNYGVIIDHGRFLVDYSAEGENLPPSIFVFSNFADPEESNGR